MPDRITQMRKLVDYFLGYNATRFIALGVEAGLFRALAAAPDDVTAADFAAAQGLDDEYARHFLQTAYALELLDLTDGRYRLAEHMAPLLARPEHNSYLGSLAGFHHISGRDFECMPALLKTGGTHTFQQHPADFTARVAEVAAGILPSLQELAGRNDLAVLYLGCGMGGTLLAPLVEAAGPARERAVGAATRAGQHHRRRAGGIGATTSGSPRAAGHATPRRTAAW